MNQLKEQLLKWDINSIQEKIKKLEILKQRTERTIGMYEIRLKNKKRELG